VLAATTIVDPSDHNDTSQRRNIAKNLHLEIYNGFAIFLT